MSDADKKDEKTPEDIPGQNAIQDVNSCSTQEQERTTIKDEQNEPSQASGGKPLELPVLPLRDVVVFPYTLSPLVIDGEETIKMILSVSEGERLIALFPELPSAAPAAETEANQSQPPEATKPAPQEPAPQDQKKPKNAEGQAVPHQAIEHAIKLEATIETTQIKERRFTTTGVLGRIVKLLKFPDNTVRILVRGLKRIRFVKNIETSSANIVALVEELSELKDDSLECMAMAKNAQTQFQEIISLSPNFPEELKVAILNVEDNSRLADLIADTLNISFKEKLGVLTAPTLHERFQILMILLNREVEVLHLGTAIHNQVSDAIGQSQREFFLREQLKTIKKELGEDSANPDIASIKKRAAELKLPEHVQKVIQKEVERLEMIPQAASEYHVAHTYIDWILTIPWGVYTQDMIDINKAMEILDEDHYDLKDVKERILEFLAVLQLKSDKKSPIICFVGPPGVGKTSLGMSIARAMGRKFVRASLGGVRDEAEIRGHRRTYVGALPGRVIQGLKKAGSSNPIFMLDEIDKLGNDFRGDPASALLEVLDPQQNHAFNDHYLELDYDLSTVMFICTANITDTIPPALLDRMEILRLPGYTPLEKMHITQRFILPRQLTENGIKKTQLSIPQETINELITYYTKEAGVRNIERTIGSICRKVARKIVEGKTKQNRKTVIKPKSIAEYLGPKKFFLEEAERKPEIGLAVGMAWTSYGGSILPVEVNSMPGKGVIQLTGSLGDVMKESAQTAFSFVKSNYEFFGINSELFSSNDFHIHVPDGATPKDGPSAGVTIATAIVSLATKRPVRSQAAMTGEITLKGKIEPVGGIREKLTAAFCAGIRFVVMPEKNKKDLAEVPAEVKKNIHIVFAKTAADAISEMLLKNPVKPKMKKR